MGSFVKPLGAQDKITTKTNLYELIPVTGTVVSATYEEGSGVKDLVETNIKNYSHGLFQSVFDYPYASSSANHIFDITAGHASSSWTTGTTFQYNRSDKIRMYNEMAAQLMGYDADGNLRRFDLDGNLATGTKINEAFFMNFARLTTKDEIRRGTFKLDINISGTMTASAGRFFSASFGNAAIVRVWDDHASPTKVDPEYFTNSPAGEYGVLRISGTNDNGTGLQHTKSVGLVFYQAGVAVLDTELFGGPGTDSRPALEVSASGLGGFSRGYFHNDVPSAAALGAAGEPPAGGPGTVSGSLMIRYQSVTGAANFLRTCISNVEFQNITELNSTIYKCAANHTEFNYSTNPTYLTGSKIRVKNSAEDNPASYITTIGLYSSNGELMAVAKLSEPIKKSPETDLILRTRLDF